MVINEFGRAVRHARLDAGVTLKQMAEALGSSASYLSAMETGKKAVPERWVEKIEAYFKDRGLEVRGLRVKADLANNTIRLDGLPDDQREVLARLAHARIEPDRLAKIQAVLGAD